MKYVCIVIIGISVLSCLPKKVDLPFINGLSKNQIDYYLCAGFNKDGKIKKWEKDIIISIDHRFDNEFKEYAKNIISEIDSLIPSISIRISDKNPNVYILLEEPVTGTEGLEQTLFEYLISSKIKESTVWLSPRCSKDRLRFVFCHEFMHSLGFYDARRFTKVYSLMGAKVFYSVDELENDTKTFYNIPEIDKWAIQIHYNDKVFPGFRRADMINAIKSHS